MNRTSTNFWSLNSGRLQSAALLCHQIVALKNTCVVLYCQLPAGVPFFRQFFRHVPNFKLSWPKYSNEFFLSDSTWIPITGWVLKLATKWIWFVRGLGMEWITIITCTTAFTKSTRSHSGELFAIFVFFIYSRETTKSKWQINRHTKKKRLMGIVNGRKGHLLKT